MQKFLRWKLLLACAIGALVADLIYQISKNHEKAIILLSVVAIVGVGYIFGFGFCLAVKHMKILDFTINISTSFPQNPGGDDDSGPDQDGPTLPDHLRGYYGGGRPPKQN